MSDIDDYPDGRAARDRYVLDRRGSRRSADPWAAPRVVIDAEPDGNGGIVDVATVFLVGRECPWRCLMCDLWRDTIEGDTPPGAIPHQIFAGLPDGTRAGRGLAGEPSRLDRVRRVKLYNAGSFFDARAVPPADDPAIAHAVARFDTVTVESHPHLVGERTWRFRDLLLASRRGFGTAQATADGPSLEVAMGLETAHPEALTHLNKGCTVDDFTAAAAALAVHGVGLRVFLLVHPPFVPADERNAWLLRSLDVAIHAGAETISLIPTRADSGAMEALVADGLFEPPSLAAFEDATARAMVHADGRAHILADLWNLGSFATCRACLGARWARLLCLNLEQRVPDAVACASCGGTQAWP